MIKDTIIKKRVADVLVDTLVAAGVKRVYGLVGDSLNGITDSIRPRKDLQWVPVRHEETAAFAAQSAGILGLKAETAQDVRPMLQKAFQHDGSALVEALVHRQELSMQPTITLEEATGFGLFMLKAMINGRGAS